MLDGNFLFCLYRMTGKDPKPEIPCYCISCKAKSMMVDYHIKTAKNGRKIALGKCKKCDKKVAKILSQEDAKKYH